MNAAVKWVYQQVTHHGVPMEAGQKPSLCFQGRKWALCVIAAHPVRVVKRKADDFDKYRAVFSGTPARPYAVKDAAQRLIEIGLRCGITNAAQKLLDRALSGDVALTDEEEFQDEEQLDADAPAQPAAPSKKVRATEAAPEAPRPKNSGGLPKVAKKEPPPERRAGGPRVRLEFVPGVKRAITPKAKEPAKARARSAPKAGTIGAAVAARLGAGEEPRAAAQAIALEFPGTKFAAEVAAGKLHMFNWYRKDAEKRGLLPVEKK